MASTRSARTGSPVTGCRSVGITHSAKSIAEVCALCTTMRPGAASWSTIRWPDSRGMTDRTAVAPPAVRRSSSRLTMNRTVSGRGVWASAASAECGGYMSLPNSITVDVSAISRWSRLMHIWCADCDSSTGAPSGVVSGTRLIAPTPSQQRISQYTRPGIGTIDSDTP